MNKEELNVMLMWDKYDNKYKEVVDVEVVKGFEADLYEANNRINDLLDIVKLKEEQIEYIENEYGRTIEEKNKELEEYKTLFKKQKELEQEKENLIKQGWLNE